MKAATSRPGRLLSYKRVQRSCRLLTQPPFHHLRCSSRKPIDNATPDWLQSAYMYDSMTVGANPVPSKLSRVQSKGQVTIPTEIRKKLGLKKGDLVAFVETEDGVLLSPREVVVTKALEQIGAALKEKGITLDQLMEDSHTIRGQLIEEKYGLHPDE